MNPDETVQRSTLANLVLEWEMVAAALLDGEPATGGPFADVQTLRERYEATAAYSREVMDRLEREEGSR